MASETLTGGCACGQVRYTMVNDPLIVHVCHCTDCQRLTGSSFAVNFWTEAANLQIEMGHLHVAELVGGSGRSHRVHFCSNCSMAIYSHYTSPRTVFVKCGTLDDTKIVKPDVHIWTQSKVPWLNLTSSEIPVFSQYYNMKDVWSSESLERFHALRSGSKKESEPESKL